HAGGVLSKISVLHLDGACELDNLYGVWCKVGTVVSTGEIINMYGLKIDDIDSATNNWAIYTGTGLCYFGDDVEIDGDITAVVGIVASGAITGASFNGIIMATESTRNYGFATIFPAQTTGNDNCAFGSGAALSLTAANRCCMFGTDSGRGITESEYCTLYGWYSGKALTNENFVTLMGAYAGIVLTGEGNTGVGYYSLGRQIVAIRNSVVGTEAMYGNGASIQTSSYNSCIGYRTLYSADDSNFNVVAGYQAGYLVSTSDRGIYLGAYAGYRGSAGSTLLIDAYIRADIAEQLTDSLVVGIMHASSVASQSFLVNGVLKSSYGAKLGDGGVATYFEV
ncbi:hypothetical protein LCGC14_3140690, partial [marine sediment metagenome]